MKYDQLRAVDEVMANNRLLAASEVREFQDVISATSCDEDDELLDPPELEAYGMREVEAGELVRWALFGDCSAHEA